MNKTSLKAGSVFSECNMQAENQDVAACKVNFAECQNDIVINKKQKTEVMFAKELEPHIIALCNFLS